MVMELIGGGGLDNWIWGYALQVDVPWEVGWIGNRNVWEGQGASMHSWGISVEGPCDGGKEMQ